MSKIKFIQLASFYPENLTQLYKEDPELKFAPYTIQFQKMVQQGIGWSNFWVTNLNKLEEFDAEFIILNNEWAQKKWAEEHHFKYKNENWLMEIAFEQIRNFQPQLLFANDYVFLNNSFLNTIRQSIPSIKSIMGWDGIGLLDAARFEACDTMISCGAHFAEYYKQKGFKAYLFQFGFENSLLNKLDLSQKKFDVSFAGSLTLRKGGHHNRLQLLGKVARNFQVDYWLSSFDENKAYLIKNIVKKTINGNLNEAMDIVRLWNINKGNVFGTEMYQVLAYSKMTLNNHIDTADEYAGNLRLWEATGVGTCLITDWKKNLHELFDLDKEIVVYKSAEECVEKIHYLMKHPQEMQAIALAGQKRTLQQYTYHKRMLDLKPLLIELAQ
jgi:hypothetical protein